MYIVEISSLAGQECRLQRTCHCGADAAQAAASARLPDPGANNPFPARIEFPRRNNLSPGICTEPSPTPFWAQDSPSNCYSDAFPIVDPSITSECAPLHQHDGDGVFGFTLFMSMTSNLSILSIVIPRGACKVRSR